MTTTANLRSTVAGAVAAGLLVAVAGGAAANKVEREERKTVTVSDQTRIVVKNARGKTAVVGSSEARAITIVARKIVRERDAARAERMLDELRFEVLERDGEIVVETHGDDVSENRRLWALIGRGEVAVIDYTIEVPRSFSADVQASGGRIRVTGLAGAARATATSGDIVLLDIGGDALAEVTSGSIEVRGVRGDLKARATSGETVVERVEGDLVAEATSGDVVASRVGGNAFVRLVSGDLVLDGCLGDVTLRTSSGDASIQDAGGGVSAQSSSGDLEVDIVPVGEKDFRLSTSSGDVAVVYPAREDCGFRLEVRTSSGNIQGDMAIRLDKITRRELRGIVGSGSAHIVIETASGDVTIVEKKKGKEQGKD
ncbi:MAG: DUF4097 family beta strand repeat-containing protein [Candidatus Krumholzibacteria bacterium]|nr:DUF4097 family beta strand repeat-containing protein [Candidatus Krumholzibacteria bacterium]